MQVGHGGDGERLAVPASASQQVPVQLGDGGRSDGLDRKMPDTGRGVEPDASPVVGQGPWLDLHRMSVDPVVQIPCHGDPVAVDVFTVPGLHPGFVPSGLGVLLGGEAAEPPGLADARLRVLDADHVRPGGAAFHDAIAEPGRVLAGGGGHQAAVLSASSLEM